MDGLEKKIAGDWFDIREISENFRDLEEYFEITLRIYQEAALEIRLSVEEGITEYKQKILNPVFSFLESLQYDSKGFENLKHHAYSLSVLVYCILVQRLIAKGTIPLKKNETEEESGSSRNIGIKEIIEDINDRIKNDNTTAQNPFIKNILMQVSIYKKELENMKKMLPNIPKEKTEAFSRNFKKVFADIHKSIEENYASLVKEEMQTLRKTVHSHPLTQFDMKPLMKLYTHQAQEISRMRSTITFALNEGFQTRVLLVNLLKEKQPILSMISNEKKAYFKVSGDKDQAVKISKSFGTEIIHMYEKQMKRLSREDNVS